MNSQAERSETQNSGLQERYDFNNLWKQMNPEVEKGSVEGQDNSVSGALDWTACIGKASDYPVGGGGFGDLYMAKWLKMPENMKMPPAVVVKDVRMLAGEYNDAKIRNKKLNRLKREIDVWLKVEHVNILRFVGVVQFPGRLPSLVFLWMKNGNVMNYIKQKPGVNRLSLLSGITDGLQYLHEFLPKGIIHGDMKAENVLVDDDGTPLLADFGLSKMKGDFTLMSTHRTQAPGTTRWKAPEYFGKQLSVTTQGDVYAYGMTCYEVMTGRVPFHKQSTALVMTAVVIRREIPDQPPKHIVPDNLWSIWVSCWHHDWKQRPRIGALNERLKAFANETDFDPTRSFENNEEEEESDDGESHKSSPPLGRHIIRSGNVSEMPSNLASRIPEIRGTPLTRPQLIVPAEVNEGYDYEALWRNVVGQSSNTNLAPLDWTGWIVRQEEYPVATGGFSDLYRGKWVNIPNTLPPPPPIAIKILRSFPGDSSNARNIRREIEVWRHVKHQNILPLVGIVTDLSPTPSLISPYMKNGSLISYMSSHLELSRLSFAYGVARGVKYLHELNPAIVHGDIKAENVLVDDEGYPRLTGYDISKIQSPGSLWLTSAAAKGTVRFMAPELLQDDGRLTTYSDVYAFAMTCVEIVTGEVPFSSKKRDAAVLVAVFRNERPKIPPEVNISQRTEKVWQEYWSTDAKERPPIRHVTEKVEAIIADGQLYPLLWELLAWCWSGDVTKRPDMDQVVDTLRAIISRRGLDNTDVAEAKRTIPFLRERDIQFSNVQSEGGTPENIQQTPDLARRGTVSFQPSDEEPYEASSVADGIFESDIDTPVDTGNTTDSIRGFQHAPSRPQFSFQASEEEIGEMFSVADGMAPADTHQDEDVSQETPPIIGDKLQPRKKARLSRITAKFREMFHRPKGV